MSICLVVDDSAVIRKIARKIMEELSFSVAEAEDGTDAETYCKNQFPDVILLDWNMPKMSGIDFLKRLRLMPGGQNVPVVFCTTENDFSKIQEAIMAGANEYIMKPFDKEIISSKFSQLGLLV